MTILGIETATAVCGAAIARDGRIVAETHLLAPKSHSERLLLLVDEVLRSAHVEVSSLDAIACSIGPGSFTGLRIGLSVAKGLAFGTRAAIVPVPTLEALAERAVADGRVAPGAMVLAAIDARRDEVYAALYRRDGDALTEIRPSAAHAVQALVATLEPGIVLVGDGSAKVASSTTIWAARSMRSSSPSAYMTRLVCRLAVSSTGFMLGPE